MDATESPIRAFELDSYVDIVGYCVVDIGGCNLGVAKREKMS